MSKTSIHSLSKLKQTGEKIVCLTAYDACFAQLLDEAGVEVILVGDSLGMVLHGETSTLGVTVSDIAYHSRCVRKGAKNALVIADMPFMSCSSPARALGNAGRLMAEGGAQMVKMEGGAWLSETIRLLDNNGIPVCGHLGLMPQSVHKFGGYRVQGRSDDGSSQIKQDALALQEAGAVMLVLECIPRNLAAEITQMLAIPVIGIGAGADCDGQVLVLHDMLGISGKRPKFSQDFLITNNSVKAAIIDYVAAVKQGSFPGIEHGFDE